jgi:hypothetical protein
VRRIAETARADGYVQSVPSSEYRALSLLQLGALTAERRFATAAVLSAAGQSFC